MTTQESSPEAEAELTQVRSTVAVLRASAGQHRPPEIIDASHPEAVKVAALHDEAMRDLIPLGFRSLGPVCETLKDGKIIVFRIFAHVDGITCGWLGLLPRKSGPRLMVFLVTEMAGPSYCTSSLGGSGLSLARAPHVHHVDYDTKVGVVEMTQDHARRSHALSSEQTTPAGVTTVSGSIALMERLHDGEESWRASCDSRELLRADLTSVLATVHRDMTSNDFWLCFNHAAEWLGFRPPRAPHLGAWRDAASRGPLAAPADIDLAKFLQAPVSSDWPSEGSPAVESDWIAHGQIEVKGTRLQMLDVYMAGNDDEGVILRVVPGRFLIAVRVMTYSDDRRVSRLRVRPPNATCIIGAKAGAVGVDLGAVAVCDVDLVAVWASANEDQWQDWGQQLWFNRTAPVGIFDCPAAATELLVVDSGFGDGTYPVYHLMSDGRPVGLEIEFIRPDGRGSEDSRK
jgi:hypothetical protein